MTDKDKIDNVYRNKFNEFELPVSDELLSGIKKDLNITPAKTGFKYWKLVYISASIILVSTIAIYLYKQLKTKPPISFKKKMSPLSKNYHIRL